MSNRIGNIDQMRGLPDKKFLRETAQMLLKYADAIEAGKVRECQQDYFSHVFSGELKAGKLKEGAEFVNAVSELHKCNHNIGKLFFILAFAHCPITDEFFISQNATRILRRDMERHA